MPDKNERTVAIDVRGSARITLPITTPYAGRTIASLVQELLGRSALEHLLAHGGIWLDQQRVQDATLPAPAGAILRLHRPPDGEYAPVTITATDICYEDEWLLALNKRAGWYTGPAPWDTQGNVRAALIHMLTLRDGVPPRLHLAHQLDRDTSGVLLCTKDPSANAPLQAAFADGAVDKTYLCVCVGEPADTVFEMRTGHGRSRGGHWRLYDQEQVGRELPTGGRVQLAHTHFQVVQPLGDYAIIYARPYTGRTHQIRLHLAACGHPLLGDTRYGGPDVFRHQVLTAHLLHAVRLQLSHPITGQPLDLKAAIPAHFRPFLPELSALSKVQAPGDQEDH